MMTSHALTMNDLISYDTIIRASDKSELIPLACKSMKVANPQPTMVADLLDMDHYTPETTAEASNEISTVIHTLEEKLVDMARLIETRDEYLAELTTSVPNTIATTVTKLLDRFSASNSGVTQTTGSGRSELITIVDDAVAGLTELKAKISATSHQQENILKIVLQLNESFMKAIENDQKTLERNHVIGKVSPFLSSCCNGSIHHLQPIMMKLNWIVKPWFVTG